MSGAYGALLRLRAGVQRTAPVSGADLTSEFAWASGGETWAVTVTPSGLGVQTETATASTWQLSTGSVEAAVLTYGDRLNQTGQLRRCVGFKCRCKRGLRVLAGAFPFRESAEVIAGRDRIRVVTCASNH